MPRLRRDQFHHDSTCRAKARWRRLRDERDAAQRETGRTFGLAPELEAALARALSEPRLVALVARAGTTNWRASAWFLERRYVFVVRERRPDEPPAPGTTPIARPRDGSAPDDVQS